ncbi:hypothetical protein L0337_37090 [candidate division KSB1 bacterium]|nr:hypothetical protein [candidate division KSB1 bacterium]
MAMGGKSVDAEKKGIPAELLKKQFASGCGGAARRLEEEGKIAALESDAIILSCPGRREARPGTAVRRQVFSSFISTNSANHDTGRGISAGEESSGV